jgi:mannitol/fructose-specific phosphotransferase system IIA component (Ntr-type)
MNSVSNHLIQLQELTLIRDEQRVTSEGKRLESLDNSIVTMTQQLPPDVRTLFEKLRKKDCIVIAPVSDGFCSSCAMKLPISLVQAVRVAREVYCCPNCARMLYYPEDVARRIAAAARRTAPRKVGISRFSSHNLMVPRLESQDREGVIRELALKMESEGFVDKAEPLVEAALRREAIVSTAVDHGVAFPHVRGVEGGGLTLALGMSKKGIRFGSEKDGLSKIIFLIVIPTAASAFYLRLLAGLSESLMKPENRKALQDEEDPEKLWKALSKVTRSTIK